MNERRADEPGAAHLHHAVLATAAAARLTLQVRERLRDRRVMAGTQLGDDLRRRDRPQHADRLRRPKRQVEPGDAVRPWLAQPGAAEQAREVVAVDLAASLDLWCAGPNPATRLLALTGVIVLAPARDLVQVIRSRSRTRRDLAYAQHARLACMP
jgi:hypothetical protein